MYSLNGIPFQKKSFFSNGRMDGHTDEQTDGRSDYIMPQILFGGIKSSGDHTTVFRETVNVKLICSNS